MIKHLKFEKNWLDIFCFLIFSSFILYIYIYIYILKFIFPGGGGVQDSAWHLFCF